MKGLGSKEKKVKIKGNYLILSEIKFQFPEIHSFISHFYSEKEDFEVHTSGSTGKPKLISIPKKYMWASARKTIEALHLKSEDKVLLCLPLDKIGGIMILVRWLVGDLDLYPVEPNASPLADDSEEYDFGAMVPYQVQHSLKNVGRIKKLIIGGAPVSTSLEKSLQKIKTEVYHTYGMTETISHVALRAIHSQTDNHVFKGLPGVSFNVDERNCLVITSREIGVNQLVTNDVVELLSTTEFIWKGRFDNVINSAGVKLLPEEIEQKIGDIDLLYFLFGQPDENLGERLVMVVESEDSFEVQDFKDFFGELSRYEIPKIIYSLPNFVVAAGGKINRKATVALLG